MSFCLRNFRLLLGVFSFLSIQTLLHSQHPPGCGSDSYWQASQSRWGEGQFNREIQKILRNQAGNKATTLREIPVVVHIVHQNGPENISATQVQTAIQQLNESFSNSGAYAQANGVDTEIGFCLAARDPQGNFSSGINRMASALTNVTLETQDASLKALSQWNSTQYLNIWVVAEITSTAMGPGVAGYASFPTSHGSATDGIVVEARYFGTSNDDSKVTVHEAGHYLGLYHTFEGGCPNTDCQNQGDRVCDTPPDGSAGAAQCSTPPNTCTSDVDDLSTNNPFRPVGLGGLGDQPDPLDNYMDYGYQLCQDRFTQGQSDRMNAALSGPRSSLLLSPGCQPNCPTPINAAFSASPNPVTAGNTVTFTNTTTGATTYRWKRDGVVFSTQANPTTVINTPGTYEIRIVASNASPGCTDSVSIWLEVRCSLLAQFSVSDDEVLPGETVVFTQQSPGSLTYQWLLDGVVVGNSGTYSHTFPTLGGHSVCLVTYNGICRDTACYYVTVGDCGRKRNNVWALGFNYNGVTFNTPTPTATFSSMQAGNEGMASICDRDGNLLMYATGRTIYRANGVNANGVIMPNGDSLIGGYYRSSTQHVLFVPKPADDSIYYLFRAAEVEGPYFGYPTGYYYSEIDLRLPGNGGTMGAVTRKNELLYEHNSEKLTAVRHANGCDIWVVGHAYNVDSTAFLAYRVTPAGIDTVPVISRVGFPHYKGNRVLANRPDDNARGCMKISPDGTKIALVMMDTMVVEVFEFDKSTGIVSPPIFTMQDLNATHPNFYGLEFSPDGSKLYYSGWVYGGIYQLDLNAGSPSAILASKTIVFQRSNPNNVVSILHLGPDGKIYGSGLGVNQLVAINNPNAAGLACNAVENGVQMWYGLGMGLQNSIVDYGVAAPPQAHGPLQVCLGSDSVHYYFDQYSCSDSVVWQVRGNAHSYVGEQDGILWLDFPSLGTDSIFVTGYTACGFAKDTLVVTVVPFNSPNLGPDVQICPGNSVTLNAGAGFSSYAWSTGATTPTISTSTAGTYWVTTQDNGCAATDTVEVGLFAALPPISLGPDTSLCAGGILALDAGAGYASYLWQDFSTNQTFTAWQPGTYYVTAFDGCGGSSSDTIVVLANNAFAANLGNDTVLCPGNSIVFTAGISGSSYLWSTGSNQPQITVTVPGTYWVEVVNRFGCVARDTVVVDLCVGLEGEMGGGMLGLFPVPTQDLVTVRWPIASEREMQYSITDGFGRRVMEGRLDYAYPRLSVGHLAQGMYWVELAGKDRKWIGRMVVGE